MGNTSKFFATVLLAVVLYVPVIVNAALVGRLAATEGGTDYLAYYDTDADLTWLADANAVANGGHNLFGLITRSNALTWSAGLDVNGVTGWRLTETDTSCIGYFCIGSEMGNLFYRVLGGFADYSISEIHNSNYDLFTNIQNDGYMSKTEVINATYTEWVFTFRSGYQDTAISGGSPGRGYAWAVHDGDVALLSSVPIPPAVWLFSTGLLGLIGFSRRK